MITFDNTETNFDHPGVLFDGGTRGPATMLGAGTPIPRTH